jgi:hypothetical protein
MTCWKTSSRLKARVKQTIRVASSMRSAYHWSVSLLVSASRALKSGRPLFGGGLPARDRRGRAIGDAELGRGQVVGEALPVAEVGGGDGAAPDGVAHVGVAEDPVGGDVGRAGPHGDGRAVLEEDHELVVADPVGDGPGIRMSDCMSWAAGSVCSFSVL